MLDHLAGRPSANWKRTQIIITLCTSLFLLLNGKRYRWPKTLGLENRTLKQYAPWRIVLGTWLMLYITRNVHILLGIDAPEPLARLYKRSYFRGTWILTALDAGFFTAMGIKPTWLRHILSIVFSAYYLVFADDAEEKSRKVRATITVEHMRTSWEKGASNPILSFVSSLLRPKLSMKKVIQVARPASSERASLPPVQLHLYYAGSLDSLEDQTSLILHFPGGGFVSMPPPCHEDAISQWAAQTGYLICSVNYGKSPEYPYPWAMEECYDTYISIVESNGKVLGLRGDKEVTIAFIGDSAGGNLAAGVTLKILAHNQQLQTSSVNSSFVMTSDDPSASVHENQVIPLPAGVITVYPCLNFDLSCWMSPSQISLMRAESSTSLNATTMSHLLESKDHMRHQSPLSVEPDLERRSLWRRALGLEANHAKRGTSLEERIRFMPTRDSVDVSSATLVPRLAMTSRMSFFNDRIITPDLMRAMAILYLGPHSYPDFDTDYLLSPIVAPSTLLSQFPKLYMMCGEKDPFVDDTVIFAGRIRQAKRNNGHKRTHHDEDPDHGVTVRIMEGMSHAFLQMIPFLPDADKATKAIGRWAQQILGSDATRPKMSKSRSLSNVSDIATNEKDMIYRRRRGLVDGLFVGVGSG
ncbi:hypothetical protein K450DRAFT_259153 [Umbelopsis ramanniana AG]|uniref:Alpha/beta hydrolase fold-3 domain-containing protein n=1 Tax=Umbelopsis ramanniana AG TaxID=1314678 RepID=A0AAD5H971_UMBRA|nr:uncharacterized protein K450DRAFT_259153 [Umbelopsis ramanniana AG]KAI8575957.1 hypothetical protein K450DRAFT_259153 [Umbelopsis ramanniana AG]